jgi:hypothetical protein
MPTYLYVSADLRSAGPFDDERLAEATDRHKIDLAAPPLAPVADVLMVARSSGAAGVVLQLSRGFLARRQLALLRTVLHSGQGVWLHSS